MLRVLRRYAVVAAIVAAGVTAYADHPVTIELRSGERITGQFADLRDNLVYLRTNQSREPRIPLSNIAVLDFTNGEGYGNGDFRNGADDERDIGRGRGRQGEHLLVLRNGRRIEGRFEGLTGDDAAHRDGRPLELVFRTTAGDYMRVNADRVARLYLAEPRYTDTDRNTSFNDADSVTVWLENGSTMRGPLTALDSRGFTVGSRVAGRTAARHSLSDVAVIDFEGNARSSRDVMTRGDARESGAPHLLVMRNGRRVSGEFIGPARQSGGREPSYLFRGTNGRITTFTPTTASRLYLGADGFSSDLAENRFDDDAAITVSARQAWTDTNLSVRRGEILAFRARGDVQLSGDTNDRATPAGSLTNRRAASAPVRDASAGALIGRVGSTVFLIGDGTAGVRMPASGELFLSVNDDHYPDNAGAFQVSIRRDGTGSR